ncbi:NACHT and WD repeat domain-containing protein [Streptomyces sp. NBC_01803]|uniref:NACHT and WD repeat domain-containing protein n=1 Tax=Streptomyces sp. NBC_01803 TaxID=2975946 RepID=UPI002DDB9D83|nr:WD40 repeat domain-containing protein [Streptomyces sp. NBC_01803]WSA45462.1 WD40 repeat domain-containing protein [Streptomyces sp. NBC_01803]
MSAEVIRPPGDDPADPADAADAADPADAADAADPAGAEAAGAAGAASESGEREESETAGDAGDAEAAEGAGDVEDADTATVRLRAEASGQGRVYQAVGDQVITQRGDVHVHYADGTRRVLAADSSPSPEAIDAACPYPGLAAFEEEDARWFFGRDHLTAEVLEALDQGRRGGGPLILVAPSGAGKSSLLKAGVLPALADGKLPGSARWPRLLFTPTAHPFETLTAELAGVTGAEPERLVAAVAREPTACVSLLRRLLQDLPRPGPPAGEVPPGHRRRRDGGSRLVLVVDQLEEVFSLCKREEERWAFFDLLEALSEPGPDGEEPLALVVYGLRSDYYPHCADYPRLRSALQTRQIVVGPLSEDGLRQAITHPAHDTGLAVEPGLVEVLLNDLGHPTYESGRLPLLAHALRTTWQQRHGRTLTLEGYRATGGIHHAIATSADQIFKSLAKPDQQAAHTMFLRLVRIGNSPDGTEDARRRLPVTDVPAVALDAFARGRLLTREQDIVSITHEALIKSWPRLREWITADRDDRLTRQKLEEAAADWNRALRDPTMLFSGSRLEDAAAQVGRATDLAAAFLTASLQRARRATRLRRAWQAAGTALTLIACATAYVALVQREAADAERDTALFRQILAEAEALRATDPSLAAQFDLAAHRRRPEDPDVQARLINDANAVLSMPLIGHSDPVQNVTFDPEGSLLVSTGERGTVQTWDTGDPFAPVRSADPLPDHTGTVNSLTHSRSTSVLAAGGFDGKIRLWDTGDPADVTSLGDPLRTPVVGRVTVDFSPDGTALAAGSSDGSVRLWNTDDPRHPRRTGEPLTGTGLPVVAQEFSPDGGTLVTAHAAEPDGGTSEEVWLWDLHAASPPGPTELPGAEGTFTTMLFRPGSDTLAVGTAADEVLLFDVGDAAHPERLGDPLPGHTGTVDAIVFDASGGLMATGSADGTVRLWDTGDPADVTSLGPPLIGHTGGVNALALSPDGRTLATASDDGTVRLWNVTDPLHPVRLGGPLPGHTAAVTTLAFSPDGRTLASGGADTTVRLWNLPDTTLLTGADVPLAAAFAAGGTALATTGDLLTSGLWDTGDPSHPRPLGPSLPPSLAQSLAPVRLLAVSPDGRTMALAGGEAAGVRLVDVGDPARPTPLGSADADTAGAAGAATGTDDTAGAATGTDDTVGAGTGTAGTAGAGTGTAGTAGAGTGTAGTAGLPSTADTPDTPVTALAFSPGGGTLATGHADGTAILWDITDPAAPVPLGEPFDASISGVLSIAFGRDGDTLAVADGFGGVQLWDTGDRAQPAPLGLPLNPAADGLDLVAFSPDGTVLATTGAGPTVQLWDVADPHDAQPLATLKTGRTGETSALAFSPDGATLATAGADLTLRLWDVRDPLRPEQLGGSLSGHTGRIGSLAFSPDGDVLASAGEDGTTRLWTLDAGSATERICDVTGDAATGMDEVWQRYLPELPLRQPCR